MLSITVLLLVFACEYGASYPISASWFKVSTNRTYVQNTLESFASIGGNTVFTRGGEFNATKPDDIKINDCYRNCTVDHRHCTESTEAELSAKGLIIQTWTTYCYDDNYSEAMLKCPGFDKKYVVGNKTYIRIVLSVDEQGSADDCPFKNGTNVAVVFTSYSGNGDPNEVLLSIAEAKNISVFRGLPKVPYIDDSSNTSAYVLLAYYQFVYRLAGDHNKRFKSNKLFKGYYSNEDVLPGYILRTANRTRFGNESLPAYAMPLFWTEVADLVGSFGYLLSGAPSIDLTHTSNTSLEENDLGLRALQFFGYTQLILRDGRGDGRAAYYSPAEANRPIYDLDKSLWFILHQKNASITEKVTFKDVYYASISEFVDYINKSSLPKPALMLEAYNDYKNSSWCQPIDITGSGMDRQVQRVHKAQLDRALVSIGSKVSSLSAFAWDPMFTCAEGGDKSLLREIIENDVQPIISECRFHSKENQSIVLIGFNLDGITLKFFVNYTREDGSKQTVYLYGYYYELDYGVQNGLVNTLMYVQLFDIPDLKHLKKKGIISVQADGAEYACSFQYELSLQPYSVIDS